MKLYRIKIDDTIYVKAIAICGNPFLQVIPTWCISESAIYEEDKAIKYCEELNNQKEMKEANLSFSLEEVTDEI